jgi:penicillin-binding protein 2
VKRTIHLFALLAFLLAACGPGGISGELPTPQISVNTAPDVEGTVTTYLAAWNSADYTSMYDMLSSASRQAISAEEFQARYAMVATQANLFSVDYEILSSLTNATTAQISYRVTLNSAVIGAITRDTNMDLVLEGGTWKVTWDDHIILPELAGGNTLSLERFVPTRGIIYDRNGEPLAANTQAVAIGVIPSLICEGDGPKVISELARVSQRPAGELNDLIFPEDTDPPYYIPIVEVSQEEFDARAGTWDQCTGIYYRAYDTRLYFGSAGPQAVGYYGAIPAEQVPQYIPLGYQSDDKIGRMGLEAWGEEYLAGKRGGVLRVLNPAGEIVTTLAQTEAQPAASIYSTIDKDLQVRAQEAIQDFNGAIVVLERDTGRILAMVSSPGFNQNWADPNDDNSFWNDYFPDDRGRFFNRATSGQYPPGSIFKPITFSAAIESGMFTPESTLDCTNQWYGLANTVLDNWTVEKELPPDGTLTLVEGIMRSCNTWFYQIGLDLYNAGKTDAVTEMAKGFGLGSATGIQELPEEAGNLEAPNTDNADVGRNQAVQQAFGQGTTLITPLQAAVYVAAIGNGGTLYQPQLVERVVDANGTALLQFEPQIKGTLPISENTLANLQEGMHRVVTNARGTAYRRFTGFNIPVYGKTGTATAGEGVDPHAWFIGYTDAGREDLPDIAIAVLVENIGDGSEFAAPIFRRVASYYFLGSPGPLYPWESEFGVVDPIYFDETLQAEATATTEAGGNGGAQAVTPVP